MPKKNKRRFFGKSNKSKSAKQSRNASSSSSSEPQQREHESDSDENASANEEEDGDERKSESIAGSLLVPNDSASTMGQLESITSAETVSATPKQEEQQQQHKATITLKVIQFVGELPKETRDDDSETLRQEIFDASAEISRIETDDNADDYKSVNEPVLLQNESEVVGDVPELDHNKNDKSNEARRHQRERSFDDNYRVESPKQIFVESGSSTKRHAMLIQEISESSSSEEVKQFLNSEASALEMKVDKLSGTMSPKDYRVESPESSDESQNQVLALREDVTVQEISESSSSESVKNEILASMAKKSPRPTQKLDTRPSLKIINIKELPTEDGKLPSSTATSTSSSRIIVTQFECKTEKKLNKAEEAILEALYGNKSLLQIPNLPLDVISEEGSDCGSDVDKQPTSLLIKDELDDDDDVFLPADLSKKPPTSRRLIDRSRREIVEQPQLINTKIIEGESNIPSGCKSWETTPVESEHQAELVYLTSTSSSATDLSERGDITDTEDVEDTSEDTETNSLLENISVPSLEEIDAPIEMRMSQPSLVFSSDFYQEMNETKLADILEEDEDQAPRSLEIFESQQQIEDVNKELHHLVSEHEESQGKRVSEEKERRNDENTQVEEQEEAKAPETICDTVNDKKIIFDNDKARDECSNRVTPTLFRRKNSTDSSSSSNNSQCTIIGQLDQRRVDALRDLCVQSLNRNGFTLDNKDMSDDGRITFQKKLNSGSRNAPQIPIIDELELHYKRDDDREGRENSKDRVITILQVPPEINRASSISPSKSIEKERWIGVQSFRNPNVIVALSPLQKSYVMSSHDSNTSADVLLDMHKKFVERRAYHESEEIENSDDSRKISDIQLEHVDRLEDGYFGDRESSVENIISHKSAGIKDILSEDSESSVAHCDNEKEDVSKIASSHENKSTVKSVDDEFKMNSIRSCLLRDEFFKNTFVGESRDVDSAATAANLPENFELKKFELERELKRLDRERQELEDELKNLQSLQHFKREEILFNEKKLEDKFKSEIENHNSVAKYANDDFSEFVCSNEKLQQELYNEWQDKVLERNERKLQKTIKITSITDSIHHDAHSERAASEILKVVPLENEFMSKLKERQKRLSLPFETQTVNSSTESLHHQNEESQKVKAPHSNIPAHLHEFMKYYEEEIALRKSSDESGESKKTLAHPLLFGLIGVSMCVCGLYIVGKYLTSQRF